MALRSMRSRQWLALLAFTFCAANPLAAGAQTPDPGRFHHTADVIYGRKFGVALTMDVFRPAGDANGAGVILVVSGGWVSSREGIPAYTPLTEALLSRGYTVFAVVHGSQPKFTIPEILLDMNRAVRYIRYHATAYGIDPNRLGICGASAGGHLSLMQGVAGDTGDPQASDPIDRVSCRVQAVACFFPPTDFLNYGEAGKPALGSDVLKDFAAPFDFVEFRPKDGVAGRFVRVTDKDKIQEIGRAISPVTHVSDDDAPALIIHGDADALVPIQQSNLMIAALNKAGVPCRLVVKPGGGHGWPGMENEALSFVDWFDRYLQAQPKPSKKSAQTGASSP